MHRHKEGFTDMKFDVFSELDRPLRFSSVRYWVTIKTVFFIKEEFSPFDLSITQTDKTIDNILPF